MNTLSFFIIYAMVFIIVAIIAWSIIVKYLYFERIKKLDRGDSVKVNITLDAMYIQQVTDDTHRVKIGNVMHDVDTKQIKL